MHLPRRERALRSILGFGMLRSGEEPNNLPQFIHSLLVLAGSWEAPPLGIATQMEGQGLTSSV